MGVFDRRRVYQREGQVMSRLICWVLPECEGLVAVYWIVYAGPTGILRSYVRGTRVGQAMPRVR